jgi:NADH-quinone oxidoreductase subunit L
MLLVSAKDMIGAFIGWEFMGLASYLLISFWYHKPAAADAGLQAFLYTRFGDIFLFAAMGLLLVWFGTVDFVALNTLAAQAGLDQTLALVIAVFIFIAALGKSGQFPFFPWLMNAMEGPTTVSALIHGATMVNAGIYIVARLFDVYVMAEALLFVAVMGGLSALIGALGALTQSEMKKILAYSTMSHLALAFVGLGAGSLIAGTMHLINHAVFKALLFLSVGAVILSVHHQAKHIEAFGGLKTRLPLIALLMAMGALSLSGLPPFSGFFSKDAILLSSLANTETSGVIFGFVWLASVLSLAYIARLWLLLFEGEARQPELTLSLHQPAFLWIGFPLVVMAALTLLMGFYQSEMITLIAPNHTDSLPDNPNLLLGLFATLFIIGLLVWIFYRQRLDITQKLSQHPIPALLHNLFKQGFYVEWMIHWAVKNSIVKGIAPASAWLDRELIDASVNAIIPVTKACASPLEKAQTGVIGDYIGVMLVGSLSLLTALWILG